MKLSKRQIFLIGGVVLVALVFLTVILLNLKSNDSTAQKVTIKVWGFEDPKNLSGVLTAYRKISPNVTVEYKRVNEADYEEQLLKELALQRGPDVFAIPNNSILKHKDFLAPVDPKTFNLEKIKTLFPQVVEQDFVSGGRIYALPYSIDTLVLLYNRDFFDEAGIIEPPRTWGNFLVYTQALRRKNDFGGIVRAGAALGGAAETIPQAADILNWLLMQNGAIKYERESLGVSFDFRGKGSAYKALAFYRQFSDPKSDYYTWTGNQGTAMKSFGDRKTAMVLAYKKDLENVKKTSPFLDFSVAAAPQIKSDENVISYPNYSGFAVSKQSKNQIWAWDFVVKTATDLEAQRDYMKSTKNPPALRALIGEMINDSEMGVFVRQALTARSWPQADGAKIKEILGKAIYNSVYDGADFSEVLKTAYDEISKLLQTFNVKFDG